MSLNSVLPIDFLDFPKATELGELIEKPGLNTFGKLQKLLPTEIGKIGECYVSKELEPRGFKSIYNDTNLRGKTDIIAFIMTYRHRKEEYRIQVKTTMNSGNTDMLQTDIDDMLKVATEKRQTAAHAAVVIEAANKNAQNCIVSVLVSAVVPKKA